MIPEGSKEQMDSFNKIMKITTSAKNAAKITNANDHINVTEILSKIVDNGSSLSSIEVL